MTTESTSVPPPTGRARTAEQAMGQQALGQQTAGQQTLGQQTVGPRTPGPQTLGQQVLRRVSIASPRDTPDRLARPSRRPAGSPLRFGLPLFASDVFAALLSTVVLGDEQRDAVLVVQLIAWVTVLNACAGLYRPGVVLSGLDQLPALAARIAVAWCAAAAVLAALFPALAVGVPDLLGGCALQLVVACGCRSLLHTRRRAVARNRLRSALVVGSGPAARRLAALLAQHPEYGLRPVGIAGSAQDEDEADRAAARTGGRDGGAVDAPALPVLTSAEEIHRAVIQNGVQDALFIDHRFIDFTDRERGLGDSGFGQAGFNEPGFSESGFSESGFGEPGFGESGFQDVGFHDPTGPGDGTERAALVALFHEYGCATWFVGAGPWDLTAAPVAMERHLWGFAARRVEPPPVRRHRRDAAVKRLLDVVFTLPLLLAASPVLLACALAVRLCDGRDVLFRQERVGQNGRTFTLLKFRTLRPADEHESATRWNIANDLRMSPVGNFLRRTSMDELPQLWNVLRGDMSLVGPRPERPFFVANFSKTQPGYAARHRMPVGITGLAQVHGLRGDTSIEERSRFDNHYIDHWSLWQDVCILLRTAASLVRPAGS
ncbi:capsular polysaccharide biosynthesis protein [Streptomyces sp. L-9-10]|uniref:sugar transferase n=1 Tax=Streptomyces sp. L-9-10 TaxID=1478131 RepID=UPI0010F2AA20|nr:sugar transferase [Streptomyces sp. L-9-10]RYJ31057.1 capsular polysaccharide biosynthesis protein [Streptomyces sp. L-9-10]